MQGNVSPKRAPVRPRVISANTGDTILLEDLVLSHAERGSRSLEIVGAPGSGKSTALAHLASLPEADRFVLVDDVEGDTIPSVPFGRLLIFATRSGFNSPSIRCRLASWNEDDLIEYLLRRYPKRCGSVLSRYRHDPFRAQLQGNPQLLSLVADEMAERDDLQVQAALQQGLRRYVPNNDTAEHHARLFSIAMLLDSYSIGETKSHDLRGLPVLRQLLSNRLVQIKFAADHLLSMLIEKSELPAHRLPLDLVVATAELARDSEVAIAGLYGQLQRRRRANAAMAASVLHYADDEWRPNRKSNCDLTGGYFIGAKWDKVDLRKVNLRRADLTGASLRMANLERAILERTQLPQSHLENIFLNLADSPFANFSAAQISNGHLEYGRFMECNFAGANLTGIWAYSADFQDSDFTDADLSNGVFEESNFRGCDFAGANMSRAFFRRAKLENADFRETLLDGVDLGRAKLNACNFEDMHVVGASFAHACLTDALLSASVMPGVDMHEAQLHRAGLADIDWPSADLRGADFDECSFHLGSTRCGLVGSPYPSHGTRTGFYTDDYDDHTFKSPEEMRKANLCQADLRDANVFGTDFYLVDLRDARYDHEQHAHFQRCGAIL